MTYEATIADVLDQRIHDLDDDARWYKGQRNPRLWRDLRIEADVELRALRTLRRTAQQMVEARPDPLTESKRYAEWTQGELAEAFA